MCELFEDVSSEQVCRAMSGKGGGEGGGMYIRVYFDICDRQLPLQFFQLSCIGIAHVLLCSVR
jgi:hypothetical protein